MAHVQKTVTFDLPDEWQMAAPVTTALGKTSTQDYDGPETILLWVDKETGYIEQSWDKDHPCDRPVPLHLEVKELHADSDENMIKIAILHSGMSVEPKLYEIAVGPEGDKNNVIIDPSDPRWIYSENDINVDYTKPLVFKGDSEFCEQQEAKTGKRVISDEFIREKRNSKLLQSDGRVPADMPSELKEKWVAYRQKLRDIPADWADVPNHLIKFPDTPDEDYPNVEMDDPEHPVIKIADRTAADNDAIAQLTPIVGVDEYSD